MEGASFGAGPPIRIQATGTITNPWHSLPPRIVMMGYPSKREESESWNITPRCRIDLNDHSVRLLFQKDEMVFVFVGDSDASRYLVNPIQYFLCYRTFINYNLMGFVARDFDPEAFEATETVPFKTAEATVEVPATSVVDYLRFLDNTLYYALAFYLIGCENPRYFLVEYYKAVEVIENGLGGERRCLDALAPLTASRRGH